MRIALFPLGAGMWALAACTRPAFVPPSADRLRTDSASFSHRCAHQLRQWSSQPGTYLSLEGRAQWAAGIQGDLYSVINERDARLTDTSTGRWVSFERGVVLVGFPRGANAKTLQRLADVVHGRVGTVHTYAPPWPGWMEMRVRPGDEVSAALSLVYDCQVGYVNLNNSGPILKTFERLEQPRDSSKDLPPGA